MCYAFHVKQIHTAGSAVTVSLWLAGLALASTVDRAANVILFIGDGMGTEHVKAARYYKGAPLCFEDFPHFALVDTDSLDGLTDSAAGATAIATGTRVGMGTYGDRSDGQRPTVLEYFQSKGKRTGLVTTDYMTAATPAAFATHAFDRYDGEQIAEDYLVTIRPNVLLGGGGEMLDPGVALAAGFVVVTNATELAEIDPTVVTYLSGQFGEGQMEYELEGVGDQPHLGEMTAAALTVLERNASGFFLMVEGANIDHAAHDYDLARMVHEVLALDAAVQTALDWAGSRTDTLVVVTADHETCGLNVIADSGAGNLPDAEWNAEWHTQIPVGCWAWGPGSERVQGFMANTNVFHVLQKATLLRTFALEPLPEEPREGPPRWAAASGDVFRVDYTDRLQPSDWQPLGIATAITDSVFVDDPNARSQTQRFYRAVALP